MDGKELERESAERMLDKKMSKHADRFIHSVCDSCESDCVGASVNKRKIKSIDPTLVVARL